MKNPLRRLSLSTTWYDRAREEEQKIKDETESRVRQVEVRLALVETIMRERRKRHA